MKGWPKLLRDRRALTGVGTAIILIAFVIVAAAFAFTVLNMGFLTAQKSGEVMGAGLEQASSALQVSGSVFAEGDVSSKKVTGITIYVKLAPGREPIDMRNGSLVITYYDPHKNIDNIYAENSSTAGCLVTEVTGDGDYMLEHGEIFKIALNLTGTAIYNGSSELTVNEKFSIDIKPPVGAVLTVERWIPAYISARMDLD